MVLVRSKTGTLDTLNERFLAEYVHNNERDDDHKTAGISDRTLVKSYGCEVRVGKCRRYLCTDIAGQQVRRASRVGEEHKSACVEVIRPAPREREILQLDKVPILDLLKSALIKVIIIKLFPP